MVNFDEKLASFSKNFLKSIKISRSFEINVFKRKGDSDNSHSSSSWFEESLSLL
jgi:hypothetical protein